MLDRQAQSAHPRATTNIRRAVPRGREWTAALARCGPQCYDGCGSARVPRGGTGRIERHREARRVLAFLSAYRIYFQIALVIVAIALVISILLQSRGAGLGSVFGGTGIVFKTRRGIEKTLVNMTVFLAILFTVLSFVTAAIPAPES